MAIAAIRHNNPGNVSLPIQGWRGGGTIVGITGQPGYAHFPDMATGTAALKQRIKTYAERGLNTISSMNSKYAEHDGWAKGVSASSGIGRNEILDPNNEAQMSRLAAGIVRQETGRTPEQLGVDLASQPAGGYAAGGTDNPQVVDAGAVTGKLSFASSAEELKLADLNGDGDTTWGEVKEYNANLADQTGAKVIKGTSAAKEGDPTSIPKAIVTAGDQQAKTILSGLKALAAAASTSTQASNSTSQGIASDAMGWLTNRLLQIMIFILAIVFVLIGLYMFGKSQGVEIPAVPSIA